MVNTMVLERVTRRDLDTLFICQAANNNVSVPRSASVKIDILGETELNYWSYRDVIGSIRGPRPANTYHREIH